MNTRIPQPQSSPFGNSNRLDISSIVVDNSSQALMLEALASQTELTREELRNDNFWGRSISLPARGLRLGTSPKNECSLADMLPWPALLTLKQCADNAARQSGCRDRQEILQFALTICPYEHWVTLLNFISLDLGTTNIAKVLSPLIRSLKGRDARIKQGASNGGKKAARERQKRSKVPATPQLLQERARLLQAGKDPKDIAGILAARYGVTPNTIRRKFRAAIESTAT